MRHKAEKLRSADSMPGGATGAAVESKPSLIIASIHREEGVTGVHTHIRQFRQYLDKVKVDAPLVTSFSWNRTLTYPVFGLRKVIRPCSKAASVLWFRHWHEVFLYHALHDDDSPNLMNVSSTPTSRWLLTLHCGHGADRTNVSSWQSTTASRHPRSGSSRRGSGVGGPCSGGFGELNVRSSRKSTESCTCPNGPAMHCWTGSQKRQRSPQRSSSTSWLLCTALRRYPSRRETLSPLETSLT